MFERDKPVGRLGTAGAAWIATAIMQAIVNVLDWGMTLQEAVMAPRLSATMDEVDNSNRMFYAM